MGGCILTWFFFSFKRGGGTAMTVSCPGNLALPHDACSFSYQ